MKTQINRIKDFFWQGSLTRLITSFFLGGALLVIGYFLINYNSSKSLSLMSEKLIQHHHQADQRRLLLILFDEVEISIYRHLAGQQLLNFQACFKTIEEIRDGIRLLGLGGLPAEHNELLDKLQIQLLRIGELLTKVEALPFDPSTNKLLFEAFFFSRLLFKKAISGFSDHSLDAAQSVQSSASNFQLYSILLMLTIMVFLSTLFTFRKVLLRRLRLFQKKLAGAKSAPSDWPYHDELYPLVETWDRMNEKIRVSINEIGLLKNCLHSMMDAMPSILIAFDYEGRILQWNSSAVKETGLDEASALGQSIWDSFPLINTFKDELILALNENKKLGLRRELLRANEHRFLEISAFPMGESHRSGTVLRIDDISEQERRENKLRQSQKMETIGTLAGGIAHNFNNILAGIVGTLSLIKVEDYSNDENYLERLAIIEHSAQRAVGMVQQILSLARRHEARVGAIDLGISIRHVVQICQNTFDRSITIQSEIPKRPMVILADPILLEQALLNICVNAAHSMTSMRPEESPRGGELTIRVDRQTPPEDALKPEIKESQDKWWRILIQDTGVGIPLQLQQKIFEPFFTTKPAGSGTGLGLSTTWSIVDQHDGIIRFSSEKDQGTAFQIWFPAEISEVAGYAQPIKVDPVLGHGLILVVDDEEIVRQTAQALLERSGYQVVTAENAVSAIKLYENWQSSIRAILLDLTMPEKGGHEALIELKKINPRACVVICSGYNSPHILSQLLNDGASGFISKPFSITSLTQGLDEALKQSESFG